MVLAAASPYIHQPADVACGSLDPALPALNLSCVSLGHVRVFMGVGAWLLGVGAATAGSLLAVSLLGQGIAPTTSQQLTAADVYQALTTEATEASVPAISWPVPTPSKKPPHQTRAPATTAVPVPSQTEAAPLAGPAASQPVTAPNPPPTRGVFSVPPSTALTSQGGTVVAECQQADVYLLSWSPAQGYEAGTVVRGPAATAHVTFESNANIVTMVVSCSSGVPTATTTTSPGDGGGHSDE
jgi:hypothetical protein